MLSDLEIARRAKLYPIAEIAAGLGIEDDELELHGKHKAKVTLEVLKRLAGRPHGLYVDVTAVTPTPLGEGKTTTTVGLSMALNRIGCRTIAAIRQPSLGPVFGIKGGAAGGGYAQVVPMEDVNLHLTGDVHAISMAHNLLAAMIDNTITHGNKLRIDPHSITWPRVLDISDRALRRVVVGLGGKENGYPRETGFDIAVASECMAILGLTTSLRDLRRRLARIVVGLDTDGRAVTAEDLKTAGAMAVLLKDAIKPTLLQTTENTPVFVHAGPFANIAHGNSSIIADMIGLKTADCVVTESGFGADLGMEKFMDIKCRYSGLVPDAVVMVCTVRALKMHSGRLRVVAGRPLDPALTSENLEAVEGGIPNLEKQIENVKLFGVPCVVAVNVFPTDTEKEIELIRARALAAGAEGAYRSDVWARGGAGGEELAAAVIKAARLPKQFRFLYELDRPIKEKIETIATRVYGADGVDYLPAAEQQIARYTKLGYADLPICMAKTHLSISHDPALKGRPRGFRVPIRDVRASMGAGFLYPLLGEMRTMPGLPSAPNTWKIDLDEDDNVVGLS
ncbi:MAG TPA: formate--tetrahydrofolate ligase [Methylomirabilota bacterium]|jgi:formate--tetrahydrofolate ligase|nr:formate--tetrahydrofolate ligase [Methylomirabilota bacterium]